MLIRTDEDETGIFGIISGCVDLIMKESFDPSYPSQICNPRDWFGETALFRQSSHILTAVTRLETDVVWISPILLRDLLYSQPVWWRSFGELGVNNLSIAVCAGTDLQIRHPEMRCAAVLLRLAGYRPLLPFRRGLPVVHITQREWQEAAISQGRRLRISCVA